MTLRAWIHAWTLSLLGVVAAACVVLIAVAGQLRTVSTEVTDRLERAERAVALSRALSTHRRQLLLLTVTSAPDAHDAMERAEKTAMDELMMLESDVMTPEFAAFTRLDQSLRGYFAAANRASGPPSRGAGEQRTIEQTYQDAREATNATVTSQLSHVADLAPATWRVAQEALRAAAVALFLAVGGCLAMVLSLRRMLVRPVEILIRRIRQPVAPPDGSLSGEFAVLGRALDDRAEIIEQQRVSQLAFVSGVAHDLRNPLTTLRLQSDVIAHASVIASDPKLLRACTGIQNVVKRLDRQIEDLLNLTRVEAGELHLRIEEIDLVSTVADSVALFNSNESHPIQFDAPASLPWRADATRLHQVVENLVSNAIKYSPDGGPVRISLTLGSESVELAVTDSGLGIPPDEQASLFRPFRRGHAERLRIPGTGLGLSVSNKIVEAHGGKISVESSPGRGSTFRVRLPILPRDMQGKLPAGSDALDHTTSLTH
jgi:signal transduction histidine kinase